MKVITYATHPEGSFEELVNNKFGVSVTVLGMGTKWNGFMDKVQGVSSYIEKVQDDEIIIFVDGFDSYILKSLDGLEETFKSLDCNILVSEHSMSLVPKYFTNKIFGSCKNDRVANSGLYMGYAGSMKKFQNAILNETSSDDQTNLNLVCSKFPKLKVDTECVIFKNISPHQKVETLYESKAFFGQTPGTFTFNRWTRAMKEYVPFFIPEIILTILVMYFLYLHFVLKK